MVGAQGGVAGGSSSPWPGHNSRGDGESCPGGGHCSKRAYGGQQLSMAWAHQSGGTGGLAKAVVSVQGGLAGGSGSLWPGHTSLGGRGVLPKLWSAVKEGLRGAQVPYGPGTPPWGGGESCPSRGWCSRRACRRQRLATAWAHHSERTGSPAQAVVCAPGGLAGRISSQRPGYTNPRGRRVLLRWWSVLKEGLRGLQFLTARAHLPGGRGVPSMWWLVLKEGLRRQ